MTKQEFRSMMHSYRLALRSANTAAAALKDTDHPMVIESILNSLAVLADAPAAQFRHRTVPLTAPVSFIAF
jgi:hypothetical protein